MRILDDLSVFVNQKGLLICRRGAFSMYGMGTVPDSDRFFAQSELLESQMLCCNYLSRSLLKEAYSQRRMKQNFLSLEYIYSGEFYIRSGDKGYVAEQGDLCLLHRGIDHDLMFQSGRKCRKLGLIISGRMLPELLKMFQLEHVNVIHLPDSGRLDEIFGRIRDSLRNGMSRSACERNAGYTFELLQLLANVQQSEPLPADIAGILDFFEQHCDGELNMRHLAVQHGMSLPTLNKRFRSVLHMTPYQYLIKLRMNRAAYLLQMGEWTIKEIAEMTGYRTPLHFSSEFHRFYGCSPRDYRKKRRLENG